MSPDGIDTKLLLLLVGSALSVIVLAVGWLLGRAISGVDDKIGSLDAKVEKLHEGHGELRDRVTVLEVGAGLRGSLPTKPHK